MTALSSLRHTALLLSALALAGCAGREQAVRPDPAAAAWALQEDVQFRTIVRECSQVDPTLDSRAELARWEQQYWPALNAADQQFNRQAAATTFHYYGEAISLPAVRLRADQQQATLKALYSAKRLPNKQREFCQQQLQRYQQGLDGLGQAAQKNRLRYLQDLARSTPAAKPRALPSLAGTLAATEAGRSQFNAEAVLQKQACPAPQMLTVHNQGPSELYAVYCQDGKGLFISCEFSSCGVLSR